MNRRTFLGAISATLASIPFLGFSRADAQPPREEPWNPEVLKQPGWIVAFGQGDDHSIRSVMLDGRDIHCECFAVNETTSEVGCFRSCTDAYGKMEIMFDADRREIAVMRRGHVVVSRYASPKVFAGDKPKPMEFIVPQKMLDDAVNKAMARLTGEF